MRNVHGGNSSNEKPEENMKRRVHRVHGGPGNDHSSVVSTSRPPSSSPGKRVLGDPSQQKTTSQNGVSRKRNVRSGVHGKRAHVCSSNRASFTEDGMAGPPAEYNFLYPQKHQYYVDRYYSHSNEPFDGIDHDISTPYERASAKSSYQESVSDAVHYPHVDVYQRSSRVSHRAANGVQRESLTSDASQRAHPDAAHPIGTRDFDRSSVDGFKEHSLLNTTAVECSPSNSNADKTEEHTEHSTKNTTVVSSSKRPGRDPTEQKSTLYGPMRSRQRTQTSSDAPTPKEAVSLKRVKPPIECPPPPLQPPKTLAQLRILLLVGFLSSEAPSVNLEGSSSSTTRLTFHCPIHSAMIAKILREYLSFVCQTPYFSIYGLRSELVATELQLMAAGFTDPFCGPVSSLLSLDILSRDAVIVSSFDIQRLNNFLRTVLRPDHPSRVSCLWDRYSPEFPKWPLPLGVAIGVERHLPAVSQENPKPLQQDATLKSYDTSRSSPPFPLIPSQFGHHSEVVDALTLPSHVNEIKSFRMSPESTMDKGVTMPPSSQTQPSATSFHTPLHPSLPQSSASDVNSIEALLSVPSAMEQQMLESGAELRQLLTVPTAKHSITTRAFQNQGGSRVQQICRHGTRQDCVEAAATEYKRLHPNHPQGVPTKPCNLVHFRRILLPHTDVSLGDCSYLDTCRHISSCRFAHYEVDLDVGSDAQKSELLERAETKDLRRGVTHNIGAVFSGDLEQVPAQWITCDVRKFDFNIFRGKVKIVMADPPWDIHMDLPYGTMTDAEMRALRLDVVQDEGCLFLWVTGRAMELGRECMKIWGYNQVEELVWVKTNQLHRLIRTGRTGHWLNHSKEHCLVGVKGHPQLNHHLDTDMIVAEVRETSRKPDEIYRIIERLCPGPYKLELFGRPHNARDNWITLGNQLENVHLHDPEIIQRYNEFASKTSIPPFIPDTPTPVIDKGNPCVTEIRHTLLSLNKTNQSVLS